MSSWYPGTSPYPSPYAHSPAEPWQRPGGPARALRVLIICTACATALLIVALLAREAAGNDYREGASSFTAVEDADAFLALASLLVTGLTIAVFVLTIVWQWRLAKNHQMLGRPDTTFGPGWAIGAWFIPLANLVIPFLQFKDLWKGSASGLPRNSLEWKRVPVASIVWLWWAVFAVSYLVEWTTTFQLVLSSDVFNDDPPVGGQIATNALRLVAAVLFWLVVKRLTERQDRAVAEAAADRTLAMVAQPGWGPQGWGSAPGAPGTPAWTPAGPLNLPAAAPVPPPPDLGPGWKPDPTGRGSYRYWDGARWTDQAAVDGQAFTSPM